MADWKEALAAMTAKLKIPAFTPGTLCDLCGNACGHCSWSRKGEQKPVPSWDAVRRDVPMRYLDEVTWLESYVVLDCPEFLLEERSAVYMERFDRERLREKATRGWEDDDGEE